MNIEISPSCYPSWERMGPH